eukprot:TRINITY_DN36069_c0_g1_i1.p1 TRINITY_DN36069_c0_g1~~TRINITY_DN36069_c0_g1_i1.p1  ORF type:complete len:359 (-),score=30.84 TRINITY_DN36069_c0_g1_i1:26-1102(-)
MVRAGRCSFTGRKCFVQLLCLCWLVIMSSVQFLETGDAQGLGLGQHVSSLSTTASQPLPIDQSITQVPPQVASTTIVVKVSQKAARSAAKLPSKKTKKCTYPKGLKWRPYKERSSAPAMALLRNGQPFAWLRFADGDMMSASNWASRRGQEGFALREDLFDWGRELGDNLFIAFGYWWLCSRAGRRTSLWASVDALLKHNGRRMNSSGGFRGFSNEFYLRLVPGGKWKKERKRKEPVPLLINRTVFIIGPSYLDSLRLMTGHKGHIGPCTFDRREKIWAAMRTASQRYPTQNVVFLMTCGAAAKHILYRAYLELGRKDSFIDVGTSLDAFAGKNTRDYHNYRGLCKDYSDIMAPGACK